MTRKSAYRMTGEELALSSGRAKERGLYRIEFKCTHCGQYEYGLRSTGKYCSPACRQAAYRKRIETR
jgi:hypothetical protein